VTGPSDIFRPSWAVMAPARGGAAFQAGAHEVHWTQEGDAFRCIVCRAVRTLEEFETSMECGP
jgi:hypothetical protein